jgi:methylated-DNA-[protein]-cysteine S-methyltransferase
MNEFDELTEIEDLLRTGLPTLEGPLPDLARSADSAALLDVAYAIDDFPIGRLLLAATPNGLARIAYLDHNDEDAVLDELAHRISPRVLAAPARLDPVRRELEEFFFGTRRQFELPLDWELIGTGFMRRVLQATYAVPFGAVTTYKTVAGEAGSPKAARAAGNALGANPLPIVVPCHRVLHAGGGLGGYTGGLDRKRMLLAIEGVLPGQLG